MLKTRIIPTLLCRGRELVKGERFDSWRVVGNTLQAARVHNMRQVDELCILSVDGRLSTEDVKALCADTFMPVSIGGGIETLEDVRELLSAGADKVVLGRVVFDNAPLVTALSHKFGAQAVVVSLAVPGRGVATVNAAKYCQSIGAGEILLQSVDRDGTMQGYDLPTIREVSKSVSIPVIASGGCGTYEHMAEAIDAGAHAVAAGALFIFTDATPQGAAQYLAGRGYHTRCLAA